MKKLFIITFLLLLGLFNYGQITHHVSILQMGTYDQSSERWVFDDEKSTDMNITINGNVISISNKSNSVIKTRNIITEKDDGVEKKIIWSASDENDKECNVIFSTSLQNGKQSLSLYYLHLIVIYRFD
jgi:hypothetical protein